MASPSYPTTVKWGKETIEVSLDPTQGVSGLKQELQDRTGVPMDRMKIMPKGKGLWKGVLKDDCDLTSLPAFQSGGNDNGSGNGNNSNSTIQLLLMGSATLPVEPRSKTIFLEDLPPEEAAKMVEPSGLTNLGNTCYLNSVVQCLRVIPHLRDGLKRYTPNRSALAQGNQQAQVNTLLLTSLLATLQSLDSSPTAISPQNLVMATKMAFPQMAQTGPQGQPMQQDAEEFYSGVMSVAAGELRGDHCLRGAFGGIDHGTNGSGNYSGPSEEELNGANNVIDAVFGLKMEETLTCDELTAPTEEGGDGMETDASTKAATSNITPIEPPVTSFDLHRKLVCNIQGGSANNNSPDANVTHIAEGIHLSLTGKVEKYSDILGRNAQWTRSQKIARLPPYLVVQFGRFYWKATPDSRDHAGVKCKVMKPVAFNGILDVYEFCNEKVKSVLKVSRDKAAREEEDRVAKKLRGEDVNGSGGNDDKASGESKAEGEEGKSEEETKNGEAATTTTTTTATTDTPMEEEDDEDAAALQAALAMSVDPSENLPPIGPGLPPNFQGLYELFAVVTHKGRDADGGHYMGWVKADNSDVRRARNMGLSGGVSNGSNGGNGNIGDSADKKDENGKRDKTADTEEDNDEWFVFDDDEVSPCKTEDILKLKGGGDWHMSYLNFYRAKK